MIIDICLYEELPNTYEWLMWGEEDHSTSYGVLTEPYRGHGIGTVFFKDHLADPENQAGVKVCFLATRIPTGEDLVEALKNYRDPGVAYELSA